MLSWEYVTAPIFTLNGTQKARDVMGKVAPDAVQYMWEYKNSLLRTTSHLTKNFGNVLYRDCVPATKTNAVGRI